MKDKNSSFSTISCVKLFARAVFQKRVSGWLYLKFIHPFTLMFVVNIHTTQQTYRLPHVAYREP